jgi:hypothetical protein
MVKNEINIAKEYIVDKRYIILNEFLYYMKTNYSLSYTNDKAIELLYSLGLKRRRIAFDVYHGGKQSRNEFINEQVRYKEKPIISKLIKNDEVILLIAKKTLEFIYHNFDGKDLANGIINFNIYNSDEGNILLFDNKSLKQVLLKIKDEFTYDETSMIEIATAIRHMSEVSYIRENIYKEYTTHILDKKFYKYTFQ